MSNELAISMDELAQESAELLPSRETLCMSKWHPMDVMNGVTSQFGLVNVSALNGSLNDVLNNVLNGTLNNSLNGGLL